jgi:hypothetical protein
MTCVGSAGGLTRDPSWRLGRWAATLALGDWWGLPALLLTAPTPTPRLLGSGAQGPKPRAGAPANLTGATDTQRVE